MLNNNIVYLGCLDWLHSKQEGLMQELRTVGLSSG
uniref:Gp30.3' n=1 Tax=Escherichia phage RB69 TaxID=12353 RepID=Q8SBJ1_BPR69|nr:gp30.3' [Escherichia phage RB69]